MNIETREQAAALAADDGTIDEIVAVGILEQFRDSECAAALKHWRAKLQPGGRLFLGVPNFAKISKDYLAGVPLDVQNAVMGSAGKPQHTIFDYEALQELLINCGYDRLGPWMPPNKNEYWCGIQAFKPTTDTVDVSHTAAMVSTARFGPTLHYRCAQNAFHQLAIPYTVFCGAYWHQVMSEGMEEIIARPGITHVLTLDYDSIFTAEDVLELHRLMQANTMIDAVCALQSKRSSEHSIFTLANPDGTLRDRAYLAEMSMSTTRIATGHFGLTLIKADALRKFPRPWMVPKPNAAGRWGDGKIDADIDFWYHWRDAGFTLHLANHVPIGHMEEFISWPGQEFKTFQQAFSDYCKHGIPKEVRR